MTVKELCNSFMSRYACDRLRPTTIRGYQTNIDRHILPVLGDVDISDLTPEDLDLLTDALRDKGLCNRSAVYAHATLRKALNYAVKRRQLSANPYDWFDLPRIEEYRYEVLNAEQIHRLLSHTKGTDPLRLAVRLSLSYGLRRGEVLGLIPEKDLDLCDCTIHIQRSRTIEEGKEVLTPCKTRHSNRRILIRKSDALDLSTILHGYAVPLTPTQLDKRFRDLCDREKLPPIRFHDLRHSYATLMLRRGVNPKIVSTVLGHSCIAITLNIYSHPDTRMQSICLEALEDET